MEKNSKFNMDDVAWSRLYELNKKEKEVELLARQFASVYEYIDTLKFEVNAGLENNNKIDLKSFDSIFVLTAFGTSYAIASKLLKIGIRTVRISMRKSSKRLIEQQPASYSEKMLRELYESRRNFGTWLNTEDARKDLDNFVSFTVRNQTVDVSKLRETILFLNKHFESDLRILDGLNFKSKKRMEAANKKRTVQNIRMGHVKISSEKSDEPEKEKMSKAGEKERILNKNSGKKNVAQRKSRGTKTIDLFWLLDFGVNMRAFRTLRSTGKSIEELIINQAAYDFTPTVNSEIERIRTEIKQRGIIKDSVSLLVGFYVSLRLVNYLKEHGITRISQLTDDRIAQLSNSEEARRKTSLRKEIDDLTKAVKNYYGWAEKIDVSEKISNLFRPKDVSIEKMPISLVESVTEKPEVASVEKKHKTDIQRVLGVNELPDTVAEFLQMELDDSADKIIKGRLFGETLQEIAEKLGVTRERIRQKEAKIKAILPEFKEENQLKKILQVYYFDDEEFEVVFNISSEINDYVTWKHGVAERPAFELVMNSSKISKEVKRFVMTHNNIMKSYDGNYVAISVNNILDIVLKENENHQLNVDDLAILYNNYIERHDIDKSLKKQPTELAKLTRSDYRTAIRSTNKRFRFFDFSKITEDNIDDLNELLNVPAGVYGIQFFFDNNAALMRKLDIMDAAELANLYKRIGYDNFPKLINIIRQSQVLIDISSKDKFILNKIYDFDKRPLAELIQHFSENYGLQKATMHAMMLSDFREYITGDLIVANATLPVEPQFYKCVAERLEQPIYDRSHFEAVIHEIDKSVILTSRLAKKLGYVERGNYGMLVQEKYGSAINAVEDVLFGNDIFDSTNAPELESRLLKYKLYEAEVNHDLLKISETKYMTIRYLESKGITKIILQEFIDAVLKYVDEDSFFTLKSLLGRGFTHELLNLGFDDVFYERLIFTASEIRMVNTSESVFVKPKKIAADYRPSLIDFVTFVMGTRTQVDIQDLMDELSRDFGISIPRDKLTEKVKTSDMVYVPSLNTIFISRAVMLDALYGAN